MPQAADGKLAQPVSFQVCRSKTWSLCIPPDATTCGSVEFGRDGGNEDSVVVVSDRESEFIERGCDTDMFVEGFDARLLVSAAQVLHGRVLEDHYRCLAIFVLRPFIGPGVLGRRGSDRVSCGGQRG